MYCIMWFTPHNILAIMMLCQPGLLTIRISQDPIMIDEYHLHEIVVMRGTAERSFLRHCSVVHVRIAAPSTQGLD